MMQLPKEAIDEFKGIYQKEFREVLDDETASRLASDVLDFFKIVAKPILKRRPKMIVESSQYVSLK